MVDYPHTLPCSQTIVGEKIVGTEALDWYSYEPGQMKHVTLKRPIKHPKTPIALISDIDIQSEDSSSVTRFVRVGRVTRAVFRFTY